MTKLKVLIVRFYKPRKEIFDNVRNSMLSFHWITPMRSKTGGEGSNFILFNAIPGLLVSYLREPLLPGEMVSVHVVVLFNGAS